MVTWTVRQFTVVIVAGCFAASCTVVTDPTKASSDFTSSSSGKSSKTDGTLRDEEKLSEFAAVNFEQLKKDMASGRGEHLAALATLLHVPQDQQTAFFTFAQEKFPLICPSEKATASEMVTALSREMANSSRFYLLADNPS